MKKFLFVLGIVLLSGPIFFPLEGKAQMGPGMMGQGGYGNWNYCPYCGAPTGPGMMGPGYGSQYGPPYGPPYQKPREPMKEKDAEQMVENYLRATRNPNLKLGKITEKDTYFEAEILTKEGSLTDKVAVDKSTGWMQSIY